MAESLRKGKEKTARQLERHFKGVSNRHRITILQIIAREPGITLEKIAEEVECSPKTTGEHTRRLVLAGLVNKEYKGRHVAHSLSPYGKFFYTFIRTFTHT